MEILRGNKRYRVVYICIYELRSVYYYRVHSSPSTVDRPSQIVGLAAKEKNERRVRRSAGTGASAYGRSGYRRNDQKVIKNPLFFSYFLTSKSKAIQRIGVEEKDVFFLKKGGRWIWKKDAETIRGLRIGMTLTWVLPGRRRLLRSARNDGF